MSAPAAPVVVSVCMLAYNHAPYIRQALDSVLAQQVDFPWEICLGEDDSADGTRDICREYAARHPDRIRLFLRRRADVIHVEGRPTGRFNLVATLQACRGRYIALLDGDDFWLSPHKLQRQVDYLEAHPAIAVCGHRVRCVDAVGNPHPDAMLPPPPAAVTTTHDLLERNYLATPSVLFRAGLYGELPRWFKDVVAGDWVLHLLNSLHGDIGYLDEELAAYRLHQGGVWMSACEAQRQRWAVQGLRVFRRGLPARFRRRIDQVLHLRRALLADLSGRPRTAAVHRSIAAHLASPRMPWPEYARDLGRLPLAAVRDRMAAP